MVDQVVVLEDSHADQRFLQRAAEGLDLEVAFHMCDDLAAARAAVEQQEPSLVIVDLSVPGGTGLHFIDELRSTRLALPAVVLTSSSAPWDHSGAIAAGARAVHTKPFEWDEYRLLVERMLRYWLG
ncbi:MAG: response regulator [Actinomycetota bacterium]